MRSPRSTLAGALLAVLTAAAVHSGDAGGWLPFVHENGAVRHSASLTSAPALLGLWAALALITTAAARALLAHGKGGALTAVGTLLAGQAGCFAAGEVVARVDAHAALLTPEVAIGVAAQLGLVLVAALLLAVVALAVRLRPTRRVLATTAAESRVQTTPPQLRLALLILAVPGRGPPATA